MKKLKNLVPVFAMALAVLGAFAFTTNSSTEEAATIGFYDADSNPFNGCETQFDCGPVGSILCTDNGLPGGKPIYAATNCTVQLFRQ